MAAAAPDKAPFMAEECLKAIPAIEGIDYTAKEYMNFVDHIQNTVDRLNSECRFISLNLIVLNLTPGGERTQIGYDQIGCLKPRSLTAQNIVQIG